MSTRDLLLAISDAVEKGEHNFLIVASGQHDIGGPLWSRDGLPLRIEVTNPGQRVGAMCLPGTHILVNGPAPADAGWLNSGGEIIIRGDCGDTTGHCAAAGKIYVGGRSGTRTGALMKKDPGLEDPELWILKNTGSFSFEFMGGGKAVVCGHDCLNLPSILGDRPCVGMVGGTIYLRGNCAPLPDDATFLELDQEDRNFLEEGLPAFLAGIRKPELLRDLTIWKHWRKIVPANARVEKKRLSAAEFKNNKWFENGLFGPSLDHKSFVPLVPTGSYRLRAPVWDNSSENCTDCMACLKNCPEHAVKRNKAEDSPHYSCNSARCIGCGICGAVCPRHIWKIEEADFE